jgi:hypothetical protein
MFVLDLEQAKSPLPLLPMMEQTDIHFPWWAEYYKTQDEIIV